MSENNDQPVIGIAGASGFVGTSLRMALGHQYRWRALTRSRAVVDAAPEGENTEWRQCEPYEDAAACRARVKGCVEAGNKSQVIVQHSDQ